MRRALCALLFVASGPLACGLDPGGPYNGGGTGGGGSLPSSGGLGSLTPSDGGDEGALGGGDGGLGNGGQGTVRGEQLTELCNTFTNACPTGKTCALYGAIDPAYSALWCGPTDLCSIVTCPSLKRCVVGAGTPPSLSCQ